MKINNLRNILKNPLPEKEITKNWKEKKVSICMLSYNHEKYIERAIRSILNQKTNFGFELLIHDDASKDKSQKIISKYHRRYPNIIKPILQTENQYSKGIHPSTHYNFPRANLEYTSICEADDCWLDEEKLQIQIDALEENKEINLCFHQAIRQHHGNKKVPDKIIGKYADQTSIVPYNKVIFRTHGWIPYASCVFRKTAKDQFYEFIKSRQYLTVGDIYFQLFGSLTKGAIYIAKPMSLYRFSTPGSWTEGANKSILKKSIHELAMIRSYYEINNITKHIISLEINKLILQRLLWLFNPAGISANNAPLTSKIHTLPQETIDDLKINDLLEHFNTIKAKINKKLTTLNESEKNYIIYGCASGCKTILNSINNKKILKVIDRDHVRAGEEINKIKIIALSDLEKEKNYELIISVLSCSANDISEIKEKSKNPNIKIHSIFDEALNELNTHKIPESLIITKSSTPYINQN